MSTADLAPPGLFGTTQFGLGLPLLTIGGATVRAAIVLNLAAAFRSRGGTSR